MGENLTLYTIFNLEKNCAFVKSQNFLAPPPPNSRKRR